MKLQTDRLLLRPFTLDDVEALAQLFADREVMRFSLSGPMLEHEKVQEYLQTRILDHYAKYGFSLYAVTDRSLQRFLGYVGLFKQNIEGKEKVELGYRLLPEYWGKGLVTEAAQAVCQYAFDQLQMEELISIIEPQNERSLGVASRLGMALWKESLHHGIPVSIFALKRPAIRLRPLQEEDLEALSLTFNFSWLTAEKKREKWQRYWEEQQKQNRTCLLFERAGQLLGYGSLLRHSVYPPFKEAGIPEIHDIWVAPEMRRQGLGRRLIGYFENLARQEGYEQIGLGVGLYEDYGPAQRLYIKLGYCFDGKGVTYNDLPIVPGAPYPVDDDLNLWLVKSL